MGFTRCCEAECDDCGGDECFFCNITFMVDNILPEFFGEIYTMKRRDLIARLWDLNAIKRTSEHRERELIHQHLLDKKRLKYGPQGI